jgi:hypothetical protein
MTGVGANGYSVAGYKEGDRIGAGVVVDPAKLTEKDNVDTKLVTVDLNLNGQVDQTDDKVLVKLPPKGVIPANWQGIAKLEAGGKTQALIDEAIVPARTGVILGGTAGFLATMPMVGKLSSGDDIAGCIGFTLGGMAVGAALGAMFAPEGKGSRNSLIGMGIGGALGASISYGMAGLPKGLVVIAGTAVASGLVTGAVAAFSKSQEVSADAQKARESSVPDIIAPKFILNQYLLKQTENK